MIPRSGFSPIANKPQTLKFQGRREANNYELRSIKPGDVVTLLGGKRQTVHTLDVDNKWQPVEAMRLAGCTLYRVLSKTGHQGREINGLEVPDTVADRHDSVDFLELQPLKANGFDPVGKPRQLLYGQYYVKNKRDHLVPVDLNQLDHRGNPIKIDWPEGFDNIYETTELKKGSDLFEKHNFFQLNLNEN